MLAKRLIVVSLLTAAVACAPKEKTVATADSTGAATVPTGSHEYSGGELLGLLNMVSDGDIEAGTLAQTKATDAQVKRLAAQFASDHQAMKGEIAALSTKLGIAPVTPKDDEDLSEDHKKAMADLGSKSVGREWDEAYLEHEIKVHKEAIDEIGEAVEKEQNPEMKALLTKALTGLRGHRQAAEELEKKFGV
jgi:putative membrane protein